MDTLEVVDRDLATSVASRLRAQGQRLTPARVTLVQTLAGAGQPLTIQDILKRSRGLALSSAYRNLQALEQAGAVHRVVTGSEFARYELAEDLTEHHHHLICISCGSVEDLPVSAQLERTVRAAASRAASGRGFAMSGHRLDMFGRCSTCA